LGGKKIDQTYWLTYCDHQYGQRRAALKKKAEWSEKVKSNSDYFTK